MCRKNYKTSGFCVELGPDLHPFYNVSKQGVHGCLRQAAWGSGEHPVAELAELEPCLPLDECFSDWTLCGLLLPLAVMCTTAPAGQRAQTCRTGPESQAGAGGWRDEECPGLLDQ